MPILNLKLNLNLEEKESLADFFRKQDLYDNLFFSEDLEKTTDLDFEKRFYGRVDSFNNSMFVDSKFLSGITGLNDLRLLDIPALAFTDLQSYFLKGANVINRESVFYELNPFRAYTSVHIEYQKYMEDLFDDFVSFIGREQNNNISDVKSFSVLFIDLISKFIKLQQVPFTRTGFLQSIYCSPYVSGLMLDLKQSSFNDDQIKYDEYVNDRNFEFFVESANRFGFLVDKKAPWRLIFNVKDSLHNKTGKIDLCGYEIQDGYFARNNIKNENDFYNKRYINSMIGKKYEETSELELLKFMFQQFYNTYIFPNTETTFGKESKFKKEIIVEKTVRKIIDSDYLNELFKDDYWLRLLLYFRALETRQKWNQIEFEKYYKACLAYNKTYNIRSAIDYINKITSNILDLDKTNRRVINRDSEINKQNPLQEEFNF